MSGLILKLRPHEELLINGVLIENGDRNIRLRIKTEGAHILRMRDALRPEEVDTPVKRACYTAQQVVAGQIDPGEAAERLRSMLDAITDDVLCDEIVNRVQTQDYYRLMRSLRSGITDHHSAVS